MTIEEKSKAYDEALERAIIAHKDEDRHLKATLEGIFPELKKYEDEWMCNIAINACKYMMENFENSTKQYEEAIAWLEKQGNKTQGKSALEAIKEEKVDNQNCVNPADKVEPKFKVEKDKWYVCNTARYTDFIVGKAYYCPKNGMLKPNENEIARYVASDCFRLWTIQDAKDGDVLAWDDSKCIALFKNIYDEDSFNSYGFVGNCTGVFESRQSYHDIEGARPATKEQRDLLFQKMKEAEYEWDAKKKVLKKIEQKPAWSEEDEEQLNDII